MAEFIESELISAPGDACVMRDGQTECVTVREARQQKRDLSKIIHDFQNRLLAFKTEEEVLLLEEVEMKKLDWEVRDFAILFRTRGRVFPHWG